MNTIKITNKPEEEALGTFWFRSWSANRVIMVVKATDETHYRCLDLRTGHLTDDDFGDPLKDLKTAGWTRVTGTVTIN